MQAIDGLLMNGLTDEQIRSYLAQAVAVAEETARKGRGGPFGAVIVRDKAVIGTGVNRVVAENDPTAHAEVLAIRAACLKLGNFSLRGCILFASCEPCPMCLSAIYWARIETVCYAARTDEAAAAGFDDSTLWREITTKPADRILRMKRLEIPSASLPFKAWIATDNKVPY